jgi:hypothetical protein
MKIYKLNDYDWVAAPTLVAAIKFYIKETGSDLEAIDDDAYQLTAYQMFNTMWVDYDGEFVPPGEQITFSVALRFMLQTRKAVRGVVRKPNYHKEPFLFASTEY